MHNKKTLMQNKVSKDKELERFILGGGLLAKIFFLV